MFNVLIWFAICLVAGFIIGVGIGLIVKLIRKHQKPLQVHTPKYTKYVHPITGEVYYQIIGFNNIEL